MFKDIPSLKSNNKILTIYDQTLTPEINKRTLQRLKIKEEFKLKNEANKTLLRMVIIDLQTGFCVDYTSFVDLNFAKHKQCEKTNRQT